MGGYTRPQENGVINRDLGSAYRHRTATLFYTFISLLYLFLFGIEILLYVFGKNMFVTGIL